MNPHDAATGLDDLRDWRGNAAALASTCEGRLGHLFPEAPRGVLNERLVRFYVSEGLLTPPAREGREALFGHRQVLELLAIRTLLVDRWPLAKIREMLRTASLHTLEELLPRSSRRAAALTAAERVIARIDGRGEDLPAPPGGVGPSAPSSARDRSSTHALLRAASGTQRRQTLREALAGAGPGAASPRPSEGLRLQLTPWCDVFIETGALAALTDDTAVALGELLTLALIERRTES